MLSLPLHLDRLQIPFLAGGDGQSGIWGRPVSLNPESRTGIVAASGSGKTTLVRILAGSLAPSSGSLRLGEEVLPPARDPGWATLRASTFSFVFQDFHLIEERTARENLRLLPSGAPKESAISSIASRLGFDHRLDAPLAELSKGQRQRVAIARALLRPFAVLVLDEPFSHLDPAAAATAAELIDETVTANRALLLVTSLTPQSPLRLERFLDL